MVTPTRRIWSLPGSWIITPCVAMAALTLVECLWGTSRDQWCVWWRSQVFIFTIAFGLSVDYELFVLGSIQEAYKATGDHREAIARGMGRAGRLVSTAAILLAVVVSRALQAVLGEGGMVGRLSGRDPWVVAVRSARTLDLCRDSLGTVWIWMWTEEGFVPGGVQVGAFVLSRITLIKMIGLGIAGSVVLDATVVRGCVVPSMLAIAGERVVWWGPRWLKVGGVVQGSC
jgi:uncharacterized membrane protein YdfJ with MMPL/SSD domain